MTLESPHCSRFTNVKSLGMFTGVGRFGSDLPRLEHDLLSAAHEERDGLARRLLRVPVRRVLHERARQHLV